MPDSTPAPSPHAKDRLFSAAHFRSNELKTALFWLRRHPFGVLTTTTAGKLRATSLPFIVEERAGDAVLVSHLAARNEHAAELGQAGEAMIVFNSPSAYVSPRWYENPANVPTWNYVGVQAQGPITILATEAQRRRVLEATIDHFEKGAEKPWRLADAPADLVARLLGGIVAFEIAPCRFECIEKLGQNKHGGDFDGVVAGLAGNESDTDRIVAKMMREFRPRERES